MAFVAAVVFGYAVDRYGLGVGRVDRAVGRLGRPITDGGFATTGVANGGPSLPDDEVDADAHDPGRGRGRGRSRDRAEAGSGVVTALTHGVHVVWWVVAVAGLVAGVTYLARGAPEVRVAFAPPFVGLFTVSGLAGTTLSFYLHFVGRKYVGGEVGRARDSFDTAYQTFQHAAMETSAVTVWVVVAYLVYAYGVVLAGVDVAAAAAAAGVLAPVGGAVLGLVPGCAPQIVFAQLYAEGGVPFSALTANAISQDGDALFPLMAVDAKAAVVATVYTTVPAVAVGVLLHYVRPTAQFGFGVVA